MMTKRHRLSGDELESLARHVDDADAVRTLRTTQYSRRLLLLRALLDLANQTYPDECRRAGTEHAFGVLDRAHRCRPSAVEEVLLHPPVGAWLGTCLRNLRRDEVAGSPLLDLAHLGAIAASAAINAGERFAVRVPVRDGRVHVPLWGTAEVRADSDESLAALRTVDGGYEIECGRATTLHASLRRHSPRWQPVYRLCTIAGVPRLSVVLDDVDPYRIYHGLEPAGSLGPSTVDLWASLLDRAWAVLADHHQDLASSIAAGLSSIVPLAESDLSLSGTSSEAFGAAALSLPVDSTELAVALVHEFQHSKLGAVLDLVPLLARRTEAVFYAPWREDPRPLQGLLQGCYAYFGVAGFWRTQRYVADGRAADRAHFEFALWRRAALRTSRTIAASGLLTAPGCRFVDCMCRALVAWQADEVPPASLAVARLVERDHRLVWRLRNVRPDRARVEQLADAWCRGRPCPEIGAVPDAVVTGTYSPDDARLRGAVRHRFREPAHRTVGETAAAEAILLDGEHARAAVAYRTQLGERPASVGSWVGYVLAREAGGCDTPRALHEHPEIVHSVHSAVTAIVDDVPDPVELANWLAPAATDA